MAGVLNSPPARAALYSASVGVQTQRYFPTDVSRVHLPAFDESNEIHQRVVELSMWFHEAARSGAHLDQFGKMEMELADAVAPLWKLKGRELRDILSYYRELQEYRRCSEPAGCTEVEDADQ